MPRIVIADDERDLREFFVRAIQRYAPQINVIAVADGQAALQEVSEQGCDLLISDQRMPLMTGVELLQAVRRSMPSLPVVIISADPSAEAAAVAAGATAFYYKPLTITQLRTIIELYTAPKPLFNPQAASDSLPS